MAYTPWRGSAGRLKIGTQTVAGVNKWALDLATDTPETTNFESETDTNTNIYATYVVGILNAKGSFEGVWNGESTVGTGSLVVNGATGTLDLIFNKATTAGYIGTSVIITGLSPSQDLKDKATFRAQFIVNGVPPTVVG